MYKCFLICLIKIIYCRGGDGTQGDASAAIPLEPHGAANKRRSYMNKSDFRRTSWKAHPCATSFCHHP